MFSSRHRKAAGALTCVTVLALLISALCGAEEPVDLAQLKVRVLLAASDSMEIRADGPVTISAPEGSKPLPAGVYTIRAKSMRAPGQRYHLFVKTFPPSEEDQAREFMAKWKQDGYAPEAVPFGKRFATPGGALIDNRTLWISVARLDSLKKAEALKAHLEAQSVWGWIVAETLRDGAATLTVSTGGKAVAQGSAPLTLTAAGPLEVAGIDRGFWNPRRTTLRFGGALEIVPGPGGVLELREIIPVEDYVAGVLPAEMPAGWPAEALKAQAVAARTEVLAALGGKHMLEGYDFCATEHCRAYGASSGRAGSTDSAVAETRGVVLIRAGRFVSAVFSANCGGCTEDNDAVWSAPADPSLRACSDAREGGNKSWRDGGIEKWIKKPPRAWCDHQEDHFRWTRRFSVSELSDLVNKKHKVGTVRSVELLERGPGGRLKAVKVAGSGGTALIRKELNIRLAFGGLPSAMFMIEQARGTGVFTFIGGGRGHGVGLCQDGACGMSLSGKSGGDILRHYFRGADLTRLDK